MKQNYEHFDEDRSIDELVNDFLDIPEYKKKMKNAIDDILDFGHCEYKVTTPITNHSFNCVQFGRLEILPKNNNL